MTLRPILGRVAMVVGGAAVLLAAAPASQRKSTAPPHKSTAAKKTTAKSTPRTAAKPTKTTTRKSAVANRRSMTASRSKKSTAVRSKAPVYRRWAQAVPAPDRYRQIQEALQAKGFFSGTPNGAWGTDSVDALKRFQQEQSLAPTGKINSLSLIALGLGPKHEKVAASSPPPSEGSPSGAR